MHNDIIYLFIVAQFLTLYHDAILRCILLRLVMEWVFPLVPFLVNQTLIGGT